MNNDTPSQFHGFPFSGVDDSDEGRRGVVLDGPYELGEVKRFVEREESSKLGNRECLLVAKGVIGLVAMLDVLLGGQSTKNSSQPGQSHLVSLVYSVTPSFCWTINPQNTRIRMLLRMSTSNT